MFFRAAFLGSRTRLAVAGGIAASAYVAAQKPILAKEKADDSIFVING